MLDDQEDIHCPVSRLLQTHPVASDNVEVHPTWLVLPYRAFQLVDRVHIGEAALLAVMLHSCVEDGDLQGGAKGHQLSTA